MGSSGVVRALGGRKGVVGRVVGVSFTVQDGPDLEGASLGL